MRATILHAPFDVRLEDVADPVLLRPTDAIVRVTASCVCGSDLWPYRGINEIDKPTRIGHEFVGIVEEVGAEVRTVRPGQFVIAPFRYSCGECAHCRYGVQTSCAKGGQGWGGRDGDGEWTPACQGEVVRVPYADGTLVATPEVPGEDQLASMLALSDVMATGWHCAVSAGVQEGETVVVVGDGAVGLSAVLSAVRLGAGRVVAMSRHASRQAVAREFGATDVVAERGDEGAERVKEMTDGVGADRVLECVGTGGSMDQAFASVRPGGTVGFVGVPHDVEVPIGTIFRHNVRLAGGVAPVRHYLEQLRDDVLAGEIDPGRVFDVTMPLAEVAEAYAAMDERRAIKVMLRP
ncbi:zinc-dependent alcohol dehydrogenase family protein [Ornithinimicrobium cerasi]|uniref:zinc-dependent alcohol dehydrogenase family protein n=1 Tax=Ornithinimicrobium cerasi TaxID=2248773 RepID=UPI000EFF7B49|nr:zinc-dependent alcohol dehydrogenase family protein [Ornithinimicrobium cerasi]